VLLFTPLRAGAANGVTPDRLRQEAEDAERKGEWDRAGELYLKILAADRQTPAIHSKLLLCSRHAQLANRHRDRIYLERVQALTMSQALNAYLDALGKLQANYVDREKVEVTEMFRHGLEEFGFALNDATFRQEHLAEFEATAIREFLEKTKDEWGEKSFRNAPQAREAVRDIALAAQKMLTLKPSLTVMEFVCGACNALDERTAYLPPSEEISPLAGQLAALGAMLSATRDGRQMLVKQVNADSWAAGALKVGDRIVRWGRGDGEREDSDQLVEIDVAGPGEMMPRTIRVPAAAGSVVDVAVQPIGVGYLRLTSFQKTTPMELTDAIEALRMNGMKALVIDLRGNPGGLFQVAVQVTERFLPEGIIVTTHGQAAPFSRTYLSRSGMAAFNGPMVLIVDGDTASAAEVLAGALKENKRAILVGQPTYGKGTIQQVLQLSAGGGVRLTLARFFTPLGEPYNGLGVTPHILESADPLKVAVEQARQLLAMRPE
jgi:C-terminal processing protease CtpA/Prc